METTFCKTLLQTQKSGENICHTAIVPTLEAIVRTTQWDG